MVYLYYKDNEQINKCTDSLVTQVINQGTHGKNLEPNTGFQLPFVSSFTAVF